MSPRKKPEKVASEVELQPDAAEEPNAEEAPVDAQVEEETTLTETPEPEKEVEPEPPASGTRVKMYYEGDADVFRYKSFTFRPGLPVTVPSEVAEELLTYPFERFRVKE